VAIKHFKQAPGWMFYRNNLKFEIFFLLGYCTDMDIIERELKILQSLRFENVVELIEWFRDKKQCFLVFEYVEWNMLQVLQEHPDGLALEQVRQLSYQLFSAIHWCHTHEIIHRDIKPENLLISKHFLLKLCDFGFARFCNTQTSADNYTDYVRDFNVQTNYFDLLFLFYPLKIQGRNTMVSIT
jgi:serine/threonine protein kinase